MHVSSAIVNRVYAKIAECIGIAERNFNRKFAPPTIRYDLRGQWGGWAMHSKWTVNFNSVLLMENTEDFINQTVPHEVAHLIDVEVHGCQRKGYKRIVHGPTWKSVMALFGCDPHRCHNYNTMNSGVRTKSKYHYKCSGCNIDIFVGAKIHAGILRGARRWHTACGKERGILTHYRKPETASYQDNVVHQEKQTGVKMPGHGTKARQAFDYVAVRSWNNPEARKGIIHGLTKELNMSYAGAQTYFYNVVKVLKEV